MSAVSVHRFKNIFDKTSYSDDHIRLVFQFLCNVIHDIIIRTENFNSDDYTAMFEDSLVFYATTCLSASNSFDPFPLLQEYYVFQTNFLSSSHIPNI